MTRSSEAVIMRDLIEIRLTSGPPWDLELLIERIGNDYLCRILGGDRHIGALSLSQWRAGRAETGGLVVGGHKELSITEHAASRLCESSRRNVICIAGIHFESLSKAQIDEILASAHALIKEASRSLEHRRLADHS